jgi:cell division protein FtsB
MRIVTLVFAAAVSCAPALAQTAPDQAPSPAPTQAPPQAQDQKSLPAAGDTQAPPAKTQDQMPSEAQREPIALPPPPPRGRYSFAAVDEGFLRFDHKSGEVALCRPQTGGWGCAVVLGSDSARKDEIAELHDEVTALKKENASLREPPHEIAELRDEITALRQEIADLRAPPPPPRPPADVAPRTERDGGVRIELPSKDDIARARGFIADTWHRLVDMIEHLQKDMMRKS